MITPDRDAMSLADITTGWAAVAWQSPKDMLWQWNGRLADADRVAFAMALDGGLVSTVQGRFDGYYVLYARKHPFPPRQGAARQAPKLRHYAESRLRSPRVLEAV